MIAPRNYYTALIGTAATCVALGACSPGRKDAAVSDTASTATSAAATSTAATASADSTTSAGMVGKTSTAGKSMSDANIFALLTEANTGEIAEGSLAVKKAVNPQVKSFGRTMVSGHSKMRDEGKALARKLNITPVYPQDNDLKKDDANELKDLTTKKAGKDWDQEYIDKQVDDHKKTVDLINDSMNSTQNAQIKTMLQQALPKVQSHLDSAQALKDRVKA